MTRTQRVKRPTNCRACGVRLRGKKDPYAPGTRRYLARGLCSTCWKHEVKGARPKPPRPPRCLTCGRGWDAVRYDCRGLCRVCYRAQQYREKVHELVRTPMPAECVRCERPLRAQTAPPTPGTVRFAARGMCGSCYAADRAHKIGVTPRKTPTECVTCHQPMVTRGARKPGHVTHAGRGQCIRCRSAEQRREKKLLAYVLGGAA